MDGIKQCNNDHFYREDLDICPFCIPSENVENVTLESDNISISDEQPSIENKKDMIQKVKIFFNNLYHDACGVCKYKCITQHR